MSWRQECVIWYNTDAFYVESPEEKRRRQEKEFAHAKAEVLCAIQSAIDAEAITDSVDDIHQKIQQLFVSADFSYLVSELGIESRITEPTLRYLHSLSLERRKELFIVTDCCVKDKDSIARKTAEDFFDSLVNSLQNWEKQDNRNLRSRGEFNNIFKTCLTITPEKFLPVAKNILGKLGRYSLDFDQDRKLFQVCLVQYGKECFPEIKIFLQANKKKARIADFLIQCIQYDNEAFLDEVMFFLKSYVEDQSLSNFSHDKKDGVQAKVDVVKAGLALKSEIFNERLRSLFQAQAAILKNHHISGMEIYAGILETVLQNGGEQFDQEITLFLCREEYESWRDSKYLQFPITRACLQFGEDRFDAVVRGKFLGNISSMGASHFREICLQLGGGRFDEDIKGILRRKDKKITMEEHFARMRKLGQDESKIQKDAGISFEEASALPRTEEQLQWDELAVKEMYQNSITKEQRCSVVKTCLQFGGSRFDDDIKVILHNSREKTEDRSYPDERWYLIKICLQFGAGRFDDDIRIFLYAAQGEERLSILKQCIKFGGNRFNDDVKKLLVEAISPEEKQSVLRESLEAEWSKVLDLAGNPQRTYDNEIPMSQGALKKYHQERDQHDQYEKNSIFTRYFLDAEFFTQYLNFFFTQESFLEIWKSFTTDSERYTFYERVKQLVVRSIGENGELGVVSDIEAKSFYTTTETNYDDENGKWISDPTKRKEVVKNHERNPIAQGLRQQIQEFDNFFKTEFSKSTEFWNAKMKAEFHYDEEGKEALDKLKKHLRESDEIQLEIIDENSDDRQKVIEIIKDSFHISDASAPSELDIVQRAGKVGGNGFDYVLKTKDGVVLGGFLDVAPTQTKGVWYGKMMAIDSKVSSLGLGGILLKKIAQHLESSGVKSLDANVPIYKINSLLNIGKLGGVVTKMVSRSPKQVEKSSLKSEDRVDRFYIRWDLKKILQGRTGADFSSSPNISLVEIGDQNSSTDMSPKEIRVYSKDKPVEGKMLELKQSIEQSLSTSINGKNFFVVTVPFFDDITMNGVSGKEKNKRGNAQLSCAMGLDYLFDCGFEIHGAKIEGNQLLYYFRKKSSSFIDFVPTVLKKLSSWFSLS